MLEIEGSKSKLGKELIPVYLTDTEQVGWLGNDGRRENYGDGNTGDGETGEGDREALHAVYRPDAPGHRLERGLVRLMLATAVGTSAAQSPFIVDGVLGYIASQGADSEASNSGGGSSPDQAVPEANYLGGLLGTIATLSGIFIQVLTLCAGAYLVIQDELSLGSLAAFIGLMAANVVQPLQRIPPAIQA